MKQSAEATRSSSPALALRAPLQGPAEFRPRRRMGPVGIGLVVGVHLLAGYALLSGMARDVVSKAVQSKPLMASIAPEPERPVPPPPPPPPPPPRKERLVERIRSAPPPPVPSAVPPPETPVPQAPPAPAAAPVPAPSPAPAAAASPVPAPAAPPVAAAPPGPSGGRLEAGVACPGYQQSLQSSLAGAYERVGIAGTVKVEFRVRDGAVVEVNPVAGPSEYYRTVRSAVRRFHCQARGGGDALVSLDIVFRGE